jgi:hypothetical protein
MKMTDADLKELLLRNTSLKIIEINEMTTEEKLSSSESLKAAVGVPAESKMNKLESRYAQYLESERFRGKVVWWKYAPMNLRLASPKCWYAIDFMYLDNEYRIHMVETKGDWVQDDSLVKFKVASETFPNFIFHWVTWKAGEWNVRTIQGGKWK